MRDTMALFVTEYLIFSLFLIPLIGIYISINIKKVSPKLLSRFHKILIILTIALPIGMTLFSAEGSRQRYVSTVDIPSRPQLQLQSENKPVNESWAVTGNESVYKYASDTITIIQDITCYFLDLFILFSISGLFLFIFRYIIQTSQIKKIIKNSHLDDMDKEYCLASSQTVELPFSCGLFKKYIFLPHDISGREKEMIISHEINHFKCNHNFWSFFELLLAHIFWFNPVIHILRKRGMLIRELECDSRTAKNINPFEYTRLLIKTAEAVSVKCRPDISFASHGWAKKSELKMRIEQLLSKKSRKRKIFLCLIIALGLVFSLGTGFIFGIFNFHTGGELELVRKTYNKKAYPESRIDIEKVPKNFIEALLRLEDSRYYSHKGVDIRSFARAALVNFKSYFSGGSFAVQGGSTITQQLAKQFLNNRTRSIKRKTEIIKMANILEKNYTKDEILEMYLNMACFGKSVTGLKAASEFYYSHDYTKLTPSESAVLASFLKSPVRNSGKFMENPEKYLETVAAK